MHRLRRGLLVPTAAPVVAYIASMPEFVGIDDPAQWDAFLRCAEEFVAERIASDGAFRITASTGIVDCRLR